MWRVVSPLVLTNMAAGWANISKRFHTVPSKSARLMRLVSPHSLMASAIDSVLLVPLETPTMVRFSIAVLAPATVGDSALQTGQVGAQNQNSTSPPAKVAASKAVPSTKVEVNCRASGTVSRDEAGLVSAVGVGAAVAAGAASSVLLQLAASKVTAKSGAI